MEEAGRSRSPSRRTSRVEQVVGRWLRRSRDLGSRSHSLSRDRVSVDGKSGEQAGDQRSYSFRFTVQIQRSSELNSHGLSLTSQTPILVQEVAAGGPADGRLVPGDQLVKINNVAAEDLTPEQAAEIIRECQDIVTMTVLRTMVGPKSSFITPEKRAKLRSNPVKVHFAEEVEVNGNSQGNTLLFLPNVLKVYLENGQTKAFKFEPNTTVKDIVMTLKEKLSLCRIEPFCLVLEQQHSVTKLLLLHEEERIQQVVQKKESHDYRCLFRVCYMPKDPRDLLLEDPTAFEYLYFQGVNDVLQERFAVEMRCNTALRLAALHIQERLASCGQSPKTTLKTITKTWGIENFVSSTLLRNMREKDLRKAVGYHMKKSQSQQDPKQKGLSFNQARINYLEELSELKSFMGKSFSATMLLQDRESTVSLLVGARYGVSQVVNHKLSIMTTLTEFSSISRIELLPESERISLVKIYLQDIKPITLLLESVAAKDMSCLIAGYCKVFANPDIQVFPWPEKPKKHRVSAEEGYVSRRASDSDSSSDMDDDPLINLVSHDNKPRPRIRSSSDPERPKRKERERPRPPGAKAKAEKPWRSRREKQDADTEKLRSCDPTSCDLRAENQEVEEEPTADDGETKGAGTEAGLVQIAITKADAEEGGDGAARVRDRGPEQEGKEAAAGGDDFWGADETFSEASDSCRTDSRFLTSPSSDSLDALEEDDLVSCSSSSFVRPPSGLLHLQGTAFSPRPSQRLRPYKHTLPHPHLLAPPPAHSHSLVSLAPGRDEETATGGGRRSGDGADPNLSSPSSSPPGDGCPGGTEPQPLIIINPCRQDNLMSFAELSRHADDLPSPPEASEEDEEDEEEELERRRRRFLELSEPLMRASEGDGAVGVAPTRTPSPAPVSTASGVDYVFNFNQSDARCYYKLCSSVTPDSALSPPRPGPGPGSDGERDAKKGGSGGEGGPEEAEPVHILQPPPGFGDSSSEEEFFDAWDRFSSPEEPSAGGVPGVLAEMKPNLVRTLSLSDIRAIVDEIEGGQRRAGMGMVAEDGGGVETLVQFRRRSRKRRSFMETTFTSRVTFPEPDADSNPNLNSNRTQRGLPSQDGDAPRLSGDPEAPEQTQNICPTVASMTHAEGEPALLESKPIPSKSRARGPGSPRGSGSPDSDRELLTASRRKKQEMEMEPDAMESKSVTDLVKTSPSSITVVRCRVEPDGKESLSEIIEESCKCEEVGDEWYEKEWGIVRESVSGAETLKEEDSSQSDNVFADDFLTQLPPPPSFAQPLPPNCFTPPLPVVDNPSQNPQLSSSQQVGLNDTQVYVSELPKLKFLNREQYVMVNTVTKNDGTSSILNSDTTSDDVVDVVESDNVFVVEDEEDDDDNDDSEEDDVEEDDDDNSVPLCDTRENSRNNHNVDHDAAMKAAVASSLPSPDSQTKGHSSSKPLTPITSSEYENTINSITAKLGVATAALSPLLTAGGTIHHETTRDKASGSNHDTDTVRIGSTMPDAESASKVSLGMASEAAIKHSFDAPCDGLAQANTTTVHHLSKEPPSPTHFLFQTCSPSIMGRLSASTLREKIQMLPLYLSRSQETLPQTGSDSASPSPCKVVSNNSQDRSEVAIRITDVDNVTQAMDFGTSPRRGSIESDDSDVTLTGSEVETEVDGELGSPLVPGMTCPTASNERETAESVVVSDANSASPVQSEPRTTRHVSCEPCSDTPGPIVKPPTSLAVPSDTEAHTPGPVKEAPESSMKSASNIPGFIMNSQQSSATPHPMVVTTQTHNGPGLSFYSPTEKVRTSTDRPLTGLCRPAAEATGAPKSHSSGCAMFTMCSAQSQTKASVSVPAMKPDYSCSSVLSSGCESAVEGLQTPLEACGCTTVYTNCFSSGDNFDDELTVYEFSCRSQGSSRAGSTSEVGLPLITAAGPVSSFLSKSPPSFSASTLSPSFPRSSIVFSSATSELSPLLSPLSDSQDSVSSQSHKETISSIRQHCYPANPAGFQPLRSDVDQLIAILEGGSGQGGQGGHGGRHARETCPAHFTENKHVLHTEARRLMAGCQKAAALGQNPEETLVALADSFRHLVELAGTCLWFSGCDRCDRRNGEAVAGLADVARSFRDFCLAAERACSKRSCQDLSAKLLAKQCTALTASVFCLTQLFRTLTAL
ncbi:FERM and PDZ domain-containing protein 1-like [Gadus chalcogrammus]|uniref:FERM and PDZ domain-containing protein 1-like n=1 Tax=Gadus chalcogrammus TaxID=1042646 RepID=UPI0024C2F799|nr:FERM and PDZ domain-containing protein 1-like [Gadus chalcogrammus]